MTQNDEEVPREPYPPAWAIELLEVLVLRLRLLVLAAVGVVILSVFIALMWPGILPANLVVGLIVGLAALLIAIAVAIAVDAADLRVRGPRHVRSAGARVLAVATSPQDRTGMDVAAQIISKRIEARGVQRILVTGTSQDDHDSNAWADGVATALSQRGRRVLVVDLTHDDYNAGILNVIAGEAKLGQAVSFDSALMLARAGAGGTAQAALLQLPQFVERLPADIEVLLVAVGSLGTSGAIAAAAALGRSVLVAELDATSRVDLLAALDSLDSAGTGADVLLVRRGGTPAQAATAEAAEAPEPAQTPDLATSTESVPPAVETEAAPLSAPEPESFTAPDRDIPVAHLASPAQPVADAQVPDLASEELHESSPELETAPWPQDEVDVDGQDLVVDVTDMSVEDALADLLSIPQVHEPSTYPLTPIAETAEQSLPATADEPPHELHGEPQLGMVAAAETLAHEIWARDEGESQWNRQPAT